jgi:3-hydroxybutyryl-CoA dehydratase
MNPFTNNEVYVGRDMGGKEWSLSSDAIENYIAGTGDDHPWYLGQSPLGAALAPALILHSEVYRTKAWYLPNVYGNLHAREEWESYQPVRVGETVRTRCTVVDRYVKREREYVVNEALTFNSEGALVSRARAHQSFLIETRPGSVVVDKNREHSAGRVFDIGQGGGSPIDGPERVVTEAMCMVFSGPALNYHNNRDKAGELGFPDIVVQGMLPVCLIAEMMTRRFGLGFFDGGRMNVNLVNVVWVDDALRVRGMIINRRREGEKTRAECEVWCEKTDGVKVVVGSASALEL